MARNKRDKSNNNNSSNSNLTTLLNNFAPATEKQSEFIDSIERNVISFGAGFPGTGKTLTALFCGLALLYDRNSPIDSIVYVRSEPKNHDFKNKGALPGDDSEKKANLAAPLQANLFKLLSPGEAEYRAKKIPVLYAEENLRGLSFDYSFVISDESQNMSSHVIKTLLTRVGTHSKMVVIGDNDQCDSSEFTSGLADACRRLCNVKGIGFTEFGVDDIVRNGIIKDILLAYA